MKIKSFEFNLREFAGPMGDFGTLLPLTIGYMVLTQQNKAHIDSCGRIANMQNNIRTQTQDVR